MLCSEADNAFSLIEKHWARKYEKGIRTFSGNRGKCAIQIVGGVHSNKSKVHSQGPCRLPLLGSSCHSIVRSP